VPNRDFVLLIRDESVQAPIGLRSSGKEGDQAVSISIMPDPLSAKDRAAILDASRSKSQGLETDPRIKYESHISESQEDAIQEVEESKDEQMKEYIFVIDRSGSMYQSIKLARLALKLFLQSLPYGSKFNIVSYGSSFKFMYKKSADYD